MRPSPQYPGYIVLRYEYQSLSINIKICCRLPYLRVGKKSDLKNQWQEMAMHLQRRPCGAACAAEVRAEGCFFLFSFLCLHVRAACNEARPRERSNRGHFLPLGKKVSSYRGAYMVPLFN